MNSLFDKEPTAPAERPRASGLMRRSRPLLGLDVGSTMIKAVAFERRQGSLILKQAALAATPPEVSTEGVLTDSISVARALKALWNDYGISENRVAASISGEKVLGQADVAATTEQNDIERFVQDRLRATLNFPSETACYGHQGVEDIVSNGVLWIAAASDTVDWMRETISLAGKNAQVVEAQFCALSNAYSYSYQPEWGDVALLLHVGARHLSIALMRGWAMLYGRDVLITKDWLATEESLPVRVLRGLDAHWPQIDQRLEGAMIDQVLLSGGPARSSELIEAISTQTRKKVEELDAFRRASYSSASGPGQIIREHGPSLAVAAGLALQGFDDL